MRNTIKRWIMRKRRGLTKEEDRRQNEIWRYTEERDKL